MFATPSRTLAMAAAAAVLSLGLIPTAHADEVLPDSPCAAQTAQVARAEDALARVTAVFEAKKDKVAEAEAVVAAATDDEELAEAEQRLAKAQEQATKVVKEKKAQQQRLAKADARLAQCEAAQAA
jgi:hypothetical protein